MKKYVYLISLPILLIVFGFLISSPAEAYDQITVNKQGSGTVTVSTAPTFSCTGSQSGCNLSTSVLGNSITFSVVPDPGYIFSSWSSNCDTPSGSSCIMDNTVAGTKTITVTFMQSPIGSYITNLTNNNPSVGTVMPVDGTGTGKCGGYCTVYSFPTSSATFIAQPTTGYRAQWSETSCGNSPSCTVNLTSGTVKNIDVYFSVLLPPPNIPTITKLASTNSVGPAVTITWTHDNATGSTTSPDKFNIYRNGVYIYQVTPGTVRTYTDNTVTAGATYSYTVDACLSGTGCSAQSAASSITLVPQDNPVPNIPSTVYANQIAGTSPSVFVSWVFNTTAANNVQPNSFKIYRNNSPVQEVQGALARAFQDNQVSFGTNYSYSVSSCNINGCSAPSSPSTSISLQTSYSPLSWAPAWPTSASANQALSSSNVNIQWAYPTGMAAPSAFIIARSGSQSASYLLEGSNNSSYVDKTTSYGSFYAYNVYACSSSYGCSLPTLSNTVNVINTPPPTAPNIPTNVSATQLTATASLGVKVNWLFDNSIGSPTSAGKFNIYRTDGVNIINYQVASGTARSYDDYNVTSGTAYTYTVSACSDTSCSVQSTASNKVTVSLPTTFYTISGKVYNDINGNSGYDANEGLSDAIVRVEWQDSTGQIIGSDTPTASNGSYSLKVPKGDYTYKISGWSKSIGDLIRTSVTKSDFTQDPIDLTNWIANKDIKVAVSRKITINIKSGDSPYIVTNAFVDFFNDVNKVGNYASLVNSSSGSVMLPQGSYTIRANIPGVDTNSLVFSGTSVSGTSITVGSGDINDFVIKVPSLRNVKVIVKDSSGVIVNNAWVELFNTNGAHFSAITDVNGTAQLQANDGTYQLNAVKLGYLSAPKTLTIDQNTSSVDFTLINTTYTISGSVKTSGSDATDIYVRAEKVGSLGFMNASARADGSYTLNVSSGVWHVFAGAQGYIETEYSGGTIDVTTTSQTGRDITLSTKLIISAPRVEPVVATEGGIVQDASVGAKVIIPANALGSSTSAGQVELKETSALVKTATALPIGSTGVEINAFNPSGQSISKLNDEVTIELSYDPTDLTKAGQSAADESKLKIAYWDETSNSWVTLNGVVDTYTKTIRAKVSHFTVFAIVLPFIAKPALASTQNPTPEVPNNEPERAQQLAAILAEASQVNSASVEILAATVNAKRDTTLEQKYDSTIVARIVVAGTPAATKSRILNFVTYGTPSTLKLGAGERAGVVNSFKTAFDRLPEAEADWQDVIKIANGRFPGTLNTKREQAVEATFTNIYGRVPNRSQANDNAAITVMSYGLRSASRNFKSEQSAIKSFRGIFKKSPSTAADWDAVRAIAYSGAKK